MQLEKIQVHTFRNIERADLTFGAGFNYLYGQNGAGKTALLEAIYTLSRGRSFRSGSADSLISRGVSDEFVLRGETTGVVAHTLALAKSIKGDTRIKVDGEATARVSDLARLLPTQILLPNAADLVFDAPGLRRSYMDWGLFHVEPSYLDASRNYRRVLQQRNAWLKSIQPEEVEQDPWRAQLIEWGCAIGRFQSSYLQQLVPHFLSVLSQLAPTLTVEVDYYWGGVESVNLAAKKWSESAPRDVKFGITHRGPHRADLILKSGGYAASETLSRGQAKAVVSALVLAQALLQVEISKQTCIILIDDFGAELDADHWSSFLRVLQELECQVIATSTEPPNQHPAWPEDVKCDVFHVKQGRFEKVQSAEH
jgi:DNA replication and repair protein RecF